MLFDLIENRGKGRMWKTFEAKNLMNGAFIDSKANWHIPIYSYSTINKTWIKVELWTSIV